MDSRLHFSSGTFSVKFLGEGEIKRNAFEDEKQLMLEKQKSVGSESNSQAAAGGNSQEPLVKELMEMGFTEMKVKEAL